MLGPSSIGSPAMSRELCWKGNSSRLKLASVRDAGMAGSVPCYTIMLPMEPWTVILSYPTSTASA